ncbi:GlsB/YeaQ/YmgE family stress response membrane protein [Peptococcus simiae]|uniref:GlsB/YeaQ/YmgE family stress response membrane protein n=1 Tax=Peptococcus simiae TaxID=1643805 RepID=A0ABW9H2J0_9FIRM
MGIISWLIVGALAGWLASIIMGKNAQMGALANIGVGIVGAFIGGFLLSFIGHGQITGINLPTIGTAVLGAVVLLFVVGKIQGRK